MPRTEASRLAQAEGVPSIAMPRIGAGYCGLSWKQNRAVSERVFADCPSGLYVYDTFLPCDEAN